MRTGLGSGLKKELTRAVGKTAAIGIAGMVIDSAEMLNSSALPPVLEPPSVRATGGPGGTVITAYTTCKYEKG